MLYYFLTTSGGLYKGADRTSIVTTINRDIHRAKTSNDIYTICSFLEKHSDALVSAHDIRSFTNIATNRDKWPKLKKLIICAAKPDKTYVNLLRMRIGYYYYYYY